MHNFQLLWIGEDKSHVSEFVSTLTLIWDQDSKAVSRKMALASDQERTEQTRVMGRDKDTSESVFSEKDRGCGRDETGDETSWEVPASWASCFEQYFHPSGGVPVNMWDNDAELD